MRIIPPFPMPEEPPVVPEHLSERIINLLRDTTKIALKVALKGGWQAVCTIYLDGKEDATEVYSAVKAGADYHAQAAGRSGKYRAQLWVLVPDADQPTRNTVSFDVLVDGDFASEESIDTAERRAQTAAWLDLIDREHRFTNFVAEYSHKAIHALVDQSGKHADSMRPMAGVMTQCISMFSEGLRMKADSVRELGDLRAEKKLAEAGHDDSGRMWDALTPAIQTAFMQFQQRMLGGGRGRSRALPASMAPPPVATPTPVASPSAPTPTPSPAPAAPAAPTQVGTPPSTTSVPAGTPPEPSTPPVPSTLHGLVALVLDSMGTDRVVRLLRLLDETQAHYFEVVCTAQEDDGCAEAIVALMQSLMANPSSVMGMQQILTPDQIQAFQQLGVLASRHLEEREAQQQQQQQQQQSPTREAAPPSSGDAASSGEDEDE